MDDISSINVNTDYKEEKINFKKFYKIFLRNKRLYLIITGSSVLTSLIFGFSLKKVWEGQFQIVLSQDSGSSISNVLDENPALNRFIQIDDPNNLKNIKTQVEILKSPSVLMPAFDYLKEVKMKNGDKKIKNLRYENWLNENLQIKLKKGTSVLNISLRDTDKSLIIPLLEKITSLYQNYSYFKKSDSLIETIDYLKKQVEIYNKKTIDSFTALQNYISEKEIILINKKDSKISPLSINQDQANLEIKFYDETLKQLDKLRDDPDKMISRLKALPNFFPAEGTKLLRELDNINSELTLKRTYFKENDRSIIQLIDKKKEFSKAIIENSLRRINSLKSQALAKKISYEKPVDVLINFGNLLNQYQRDEKTLTSLQFKLTELSIQSEKGIKSWELITNPTRQDNPVKPSKKRITILGFILGNIFSILVISIIEKRKGILFEEDDISKILNIPISLNLVNRELEFTDELIDNYSIKFNNKFKSSKIKLFIIGKTNPKLVEEFKSQLNKRLKNQSIEITENLKVNDNFQILITSLGVVNINELNLIKKRLDLQGNELNDLVILGGKL